MSANILKQYGFKQVAKSGAASQPTNIVKKSFNISIVRSQDHVNPQIVFKLPRDILDQMKWDISDRVTVLSNAKSHKIALSKTSKKDPESFAISAQGASIETAKILKRGGIVKVGWRADICEEITGHNTYETTCEFFDNSLIISLPKEIFA